jgi:predicted ATPase/tRNA A-37 threonylcarbamoyl transferase component Bud32
MALGDLINNRYRLLSSLGIGGMGAVYRAYDRLTGETVALKHVRLTRSDDSPASADDIALARLALAREFQFLASLRHPNIITVRDYGFDAQQQPYFTMDLLDNPQSFLDVGRTQSTPRKIELLLQILQALAYLHRRGILHRDLKPANVLVTGDRVKVLDFGLSSAPDDQPDTPSGTLAYIAPEVLMGETATAAADLYAVGVMAYELFTGQHPFHSDRAEVSINAILLKPADVTAITDQSIARVIEQLLAKLPADRFNDAPTVMAALSAAIDQAPPPETIELRESYLQAAHFVGRETEIDQLTQAVQAAVNKHGGAILIGGESGVGKSRLLNEFRTRALVQGALVLRGQAISAGGQPYAAWREVARWLLLLTQLTELQASVLKALVPDIDQLLEREIPEAPALDPKEARLRLLTTITDLVRQACAARSIVLLMEDWHWADANSTALLNQLSRSAIDQALLIAITYRDDEAPNFKDQIQFSQLIKLPRFNADNIAQLAAAMLGPAGEAPHLINFLQRETEGNVFFVVEVMRALAEETGQLDRVAYAALPVSVFASGIRNVVNRRLDRVPLEDRAALQLAAIAGRQLDLAILRSASAQTDWDHWLIVCADAAVLEVQDDRWQFAHDKLREGVLRRLEVDQQRALHQTIAASIEQVYAQNLAAHYGELAYHFGEAQQTDRERHYARLAGQQAAAQFDNDHAAQYLNRALELTDENDLIERYELLLARERVFDLQGAKDLRADDLAALGNLAEQVHDDRKRAEVALRQASFHEGQGDFETAIVSAQRAIAISEAAQLIESEAAGYFRWGQMLWSRAEYAEANTQLGRALSIAREADLKEVELECLRNLGLVAWSQDDPAGAENYFDQSLQLCRSVGDKRSEAKALNNLGLARLDQYDFAAAQAYFNQSYQIFQSMGDRRGEAGALGNLGLTALERGDYANGQTYVERYLSISRAIGDRQAESIAGVNLSLIFYYLGQLDLAETYGRSALSFSRAIGSKRVEAYALHRLGNILLAANRVSEATESYQHALNLRRELGQQHLALESLAGLAQTSLASGQLNEAHDQVKEIRQHLQTEAIDGTDEPFRIHLICYRVLKAIDDPQAGEVLQQAYALLQARADRLSDEVARRKFLENIPSHRELMEEVGGH